MLTRSVGILLVVAVWVGAASAAAATPPAKALLAAVAKSGRVGSARIDVTEQVKAGGKKALELRITGVQRTGAQEGSFHYHVSPAQPGLGDATIVVKGPSVWVHYPAFDTLRASNAAVKKWLLVDTKSNLGFNPTGLASVGTQEIRQMKGLALLSRGTEGGVPVTWYGGTIALAKLAESTQLQSLYASVPSEVASLLRGTERVRVAVGRDGLIHRMVAGITAPLSNGTKLAITVDARLSDFGKANRPIAAPKRSQVMTVAQFQQATGATASAADTALLGKVVLPAGEVGRGYVRSVIPGGKLVDGETTLDFCDKTYASESLRSARLQVAFNVKGSSPTLSNEVVTYQSDGAQQALAELRQALTTCKTGRLANAPKGVTNLRRQFHTVTGRGLLPGSIAIVEIDSGTVKGKRVTDRIAMVYQARGNVLSAVYADGGSTAAVQRAALQAAARSAVRVRKNVGAGDIR